MRFDAVALDLDGTLYPALSLYARAAPLLLGKARSFVAFNATRRELRALGSDRARRPAQLSEGRGFRDLQAELVAARLGIKPEEARLIIERDFYRSVEELFVSVRPYRGLEAALSSLSGAGLRLGLLSDLPPGRKLELMGLSGRFEVCLCSEDSGFLKPAPEPFALLASRMGLAPERILYVGNSPAIDLAGAKAAGMSAALISRRRVAGADFCFFDWGSLVRFATSPR